MGDEEKTDFDPTGAAGPTERPRRWRFRGKLIVTPAGGEAREMYINRDNYVIGRDDGCSLILDDDSASRFHARLTEVGDGLCVEDLGSKNGTLLNGVAVRSARLNSGDELVIGDTLLVFEK